MEQAASLDCARLFNSAVERLHEYGKDRIKKGTE